ncbi:hypothetical protein, partial [Acidithiobacillus sp.]
MPLRFDLDYTDPAIAFDPLIDEVFGELQSSFLEMPRGEGFTDYVTFEKGYQALKRSTNDFTNVTATSIEAAVMAAPIAFIVFRSILGFTPPEWAYVTTERTGVCVDQGAARTMDRNIRLKPLTPRILGATLADQRLRAMIQAGVETLTAGPVPDSAAMVHRLNKVDTKEGIKSLQPIADLGVPYAVLLYERFLGRPFASHRDAVSELVG